jgi:peptide chain release factor 1
VAVDRVALLGFDGAEVVNGLADDVEDATQGRLADGHRDRAAGVNRRHAADDAFGRLHRDGADAAFAEVLLDFGDDVNRRGHVEALARDAKCGVDRRQVSLLELNVEDGADDLYDAPRGVAVRRGVGVSGHTLLEYSSSG